jgi:hypothetical protein
VPTNTKPTYAKASVGEGGVEGTDFELLDQRFADYQAVYWFVVILTFQQFGFLC